MTAKKATPPDAAPETKPEPKPKFHRMFVVTGRTITEDKSEGAVLREVDAGGNLLPDDRVYTGKEILRLTIGNIYKMEVPSMEGTSIFGATASYQGQWPKAEQRMEWQLRADAFRTTQRMKKLEKTEGKMQEIDEYLEPLRRIMTKTSFADQAALETIILRKLRRPVRLKSTD